MLEEDREPPPPRYRRIGAWIAKNPTAALAVAVGLALLVSLAFHQVHPWAITAEIARDYRLAEQRNELVARHVSLGQRYLAAEQLVAARVEFKRALELEKTNVDAQRGLFRATVLEPITRGDYDPQIVGERLQFLVDEDDEDANAHAYLGDVYLGIGDYARALEHYNRAIESDPKLAHAHSGAAWVHELSGDFDRAVASYERAAEAAPWNATYKNNVASIYFRADRLEDSEAAFERVVALDRNFLIPYHGAARVHRALGHFEKAWEKQSLALRLMKDPTIAKLDRNNPERSRKEWSLAALRWQSADTLDKPTTLALQNARTRRAYMLWSFAFSSYLDEKVTTAAQAARSARRIRLGPDEASTVRNIVDFDLRLVEERQQTAGKRVRMFARKLLRGFGRPRATRESRRT